jgi:putative transcriptional regulator
MITLDELLPYEPDEEFERLLTGSDQNDSKQKHQDRPLYYGRRPVNRLFAVRNSRKMTQAALAKWTGSTRRTIRDIENQRRAPSVYLAVALAQALAVSVEDIFMLESLTPVPVSKH